MPASGKGFCLFPPSSLIGQRGKAAHRVALQVIPTVILRLPLASFLLHHSQGSWPSLPRCRHLPTVLICACLLPASFSITHWAARQGQQGCPLHPQCWLVPSVLVCACLSQGSVGDSCQLPPLLLAGAPASGQLSPSSLTGSLGMAAHSFSLCLQYLFVPASGPLPSSSLIRQLDLPVHSGGVHPVCCFAPASQSGQRHSSSLTWQLCWASQSVTVPGCTLCQLCQLHLSTAPCCLLSSLLSLH